MRTSPFRGFWGPVHVILTLEDFLYHTALPKALSLHNHCQLITTSQLVVYLEIFDPDARVNNRHAWHDQGYLRLSLRCFEDEPTEACCLRYPVVMISSGFVTLKHFGYHAGVFKVYV